MPINGRGAVRGGGGGGGWGRRCSPGYVAFTQKSEVLQAQPKGEEGSDTVKEEAPHVPSVKKPGGGAYSKMLKKSEISW